MGSWNGCGRGWLNEIREDVKARTPIILQAKPRYYRESQSLNDFEGHENLEEERRK